MSILPPPTSLPAPGRVTSLGESGAPGPPGIAATDGELLAAFAREPSDNDHFQRLVERHGAMVWGVCRQLLGHRQDAEDAYQATFLILARRNRAIRSSDSAAGWLYRVAYRTAMATKRRGRKRKELPLEGELLAKGEEPFPDLVGRQSVATLLEELRGLPAKYQTPLVMRYLEGQSRRAIAEQTDTTVATVQGRLARGKQLLRRRLLRRGVSLSVAMAAASLASREAGAAPSGLAASVTTDAAALVSGGSLAASAAAVSLCREGVRAMIYGQAIQPVAATAASLIVFAAVVAAAPASGQANGDAPSGAVVIDASAPDAVAVFPPATSLSATPAHTPPPDPPIAPPAVAAPAPLPIQRNQAEHPSPALLRDQPAPPQPPTPPNAPANLTGPYADAVLAFGDNVEVAIWGGDPKFAIAGGGGSIDAAGALDLRGQFGKVSGVGGQTLAGAQVLIGDHVRLVAADPRLRVRVMHDRFGVAGGGVTTPQLATVAEANARTNRTVFVEAVTVNVGEPSRPKGGEPTEALLKEAEALLKEAEQHTTKTEELAEQAAAMWELEGDQPTGRERKADPLFGGGFGGGYGGTRGGGGLGGGYGSRGPQPGVVTATIIEMVQAEAEQASVSLNSARGKSRQWSARRVKGILGADEAKRRELLSSIHEHVTSLTERTVALERRLDTAIQRAQAPRQWIERQWKAAEERNARAAADEQRKQSELARRQAEQAKLRATLSKQELGQYQREQQRAREASKVAALQQQLLAKQQELEVLRRQLQQRDDPAKLDYTFPQQRFHRLPWTRGHKGDHVRWLQKRINQVLPNPNLDIDGDFGPATADNVRRVQEQFNLEPTGEVDESLHRRLEALPGPAGLPVAPPPPQPATPS